MKAYIFLDGKLHREIDISYWAIPGFICQYNTQAIKRAAIDLIGTSSKIVEVFVPPNTVF